MALAKIQQKFKKSFEKVIGLKLTYNADDDIFEINSPTGYYIGAIMLIKQENEAYSIMDCTEDDVRPGFDDLELEVTDLMVKY